MRDPWMGRTRLWQTSPSPPSDWCDLTLVRVQDQVLIALVVDGAPGRASARPPWPRETLFAEVGEVFLDHTAPETMLRALGDRLRVACHGQVWRFSAAAVAVRWDADSGVLEVAEAGDTKAWLVGHPAPTPLTEGGIPQPGRPLREMLGSMAPDIRSKQLKLTVGNGPGVSSVALLTDGAYAILKSPTGILPIDPSAWALVDTVGADDATLLLIQPPI